MAANSVEKFQACRTKPKRRWRWVLLSFCLLIFLLGCWFFWPRSDRMPALAAELDKTDPDWRWDDLRKADSIQEAENALPHLQALAKALPPTFAALRSSLVVKPAYPCSIRDDVDKAGRNCKSPLGGTPLCLRGEGAGV